MKAEWKQKWVDALRGGKYIQVMSRLHDGDCMCALGVLNDLSGVGHWFDDSYVVASEDWIDDDEADCLPRPVDALRVEVDGYLQISNPENPEPYWVTPEYLVEHGVLYAEEEHLHPAVSALAGCPTEPDVNVGGDRWAKVYDLNDAGLSFKRIADLVEASPGFEAPGETLKSHEVSRLVEDMREDHLKSF